MAPIHISDLEAAINHWRERLPSPDGLSLAEPTRALAEVYARLVYEQQDEIEMAQLSGDARQAWLDWYDTTPDTPCIAICSTSQGDEVCKGCGRAFGEIQAWPTLPPTDKREVWRRIVQENTAWRFHQYAERALENRPVGAGRACPGDSCSSRGQRGCAGGCNLGD